MRAGRFGSAGALLPDAAAEPDGEPVDGLLGKGEPPVAAAGGVAGAEEVAEEVEGELAVAAELAALPAGGADPADAAGAGGGEDVAQVGGRGGSPPHAGLRKLTSS